MPVFYFLETKCLGLVILNLGPCLFGVKYVPYFLMFGETKKVNQWKTFSVVNEN